MSFVRGRSSPALLAVLAAATACSGDARRAPTAEIRDSAGIRIVENTAPGWTQEEAWRLGDEPVVELGGEETFHEIGNVLRLRDGRIIVGHNSANEILVFSPAGDLLDRFGRAGGGPGEFGEISRLFAFAGGDSLLVFDYTRFRASVFDSRGEFVRTFTPPPLGTRLPGAVEGAFDDGSLLLISLPQRTPELRGLVRSPRTLWRASAEGVEATRIVEFPGQETFFQESPFGPVDFRRPFFGQTSSYATWKDRVVWSATDSNEIRVHANDGRMLAVIRRPPAPVMVPSDAVDRLIEDRLAAVDDANARRQARQMLENLPASDVAPAFGWPVWAARYGPDMQLDDDGNLWLVEYFMPGEDRNERSVFDSTGVWLGTVTLPARFAPAHIGSDFALGTWTDSLDVEHVRLYALIKPAP